MLSAGLPACAAIAISSDGASHARSRAGGRERVIEDG
jgi:hypothetical protein